MAYQEELQGILAEYDQAVQELQKKRKALDGILGLGNHPGNAACHELMDRQVEALCRKAGEEGSPGERAALVRTIFETESAWRGPEYARLMLVAIQRHTLGILPGLEKADRDALAAWYQKQYPRRKRLPVQEQVLAALKGE